MNELSLHYSWKDLGRASEYPLPDSVELLVAPAKGRGWTGYAIMPLPHGSEGTHIITAKITEPTQAKLVWKLLSYMIAEIEGKKLNRGG